MLPPKRASVISDNTSQNQHQNGNQQILEKGRPAPTTLMIFQLHTLVKEFFGADTPNGPPEMLLPETPRKGLDYRLPVKEDPAQGTMQPASSGNGRITMFLLTLHRSKTCFTQRYSFPDGQHQFEPTYAGVIIQLYFKGIDIFSVRWYFSRLFLLSNEAVLYNFITSFQQCLHSPQNFLAKAV